MTGKILENITGTKKSNYAKEDIMNGICRLKKVQQQNFQPFKISLDIAHRIISFSKMNTIM